MTEGELRAELERVTAELDALREDSNRMRALVGVMEVVLKDEPPPAAIPSRIDQLRTLVKTILYPSSGFLSDANDVDDTDHAQEERGSRRAGGGGGGIGGKWSKLKFR